MAKKQKHEDHENLERWLVSYGDFITLLFATFVVLYALSQVDISEFTKLEESLKQAFNAPSIIEGAETIMPDSGMSILDSSSADSVIAPLMLEYISQKYEETAFDEIEKSIESMKKEGDLEGVDAKITDRGLLITFSEDMLFSSATATLTDKAIKALDAIGVLISEKFALHYVRVEGHTDNLPIQSYVYPSNWELSSARASSIIRYFLERFKFMPSLFTAIGYADTRPLVDNSTPENRNKNRRVEILVMKNQYKKMELPSQGILSKSKKEQEKFQSERISAINNVKMISKASQNLEARKKEEAKLENSKSKILKVPFENLKTRKEKSISVKNKTIYEQATNHEDDWLKIPSSKEFDKVMDKKFDVIGQ